MEYVWGYWKHHELANFCPRNFIQLAGSQEDKHRQIADHDTTVRAAMLAERARLLPLAELDGCLRVATR